MTASMITADQSATYEVKEVGIIIVALAFAIVLGSAALTAVVICGWKGAKNVSIDWAHGRATFACR
jgi:hypothetical protein